jgi:hypothetical protein
MPNRLLLVFAVLAFLSCNNNKPPDKPVKPVVTDSQPAAKANRDANSWTPVDVSPMDMTYYPVDYPKIKTASSAPPFARIIYSRPHLQGRKIFHEILKYGEPWRLGANEATELDLYRDATIQGKKIKQGRYIIYCIPEKDKWTIVLNSNIDSWGLHPDPSKDVDRFVIPVTNTPDSLEFFTILFRNGPNNAAEIYMAWDNVEAVLPVEF